MCAVKQQNKFFSNGNNVFLDFATKKGLKEKEQCILYNNKSAIKIQSH